MKKQVTSKTYRVEMNKYGVKCGGDLNMWESSGWISTIDPYGWFQCTSTRRERDARARERERERRIFAFFLGLDWIGLDGMEVDGWHSIS
jgi:hypothetical protein